MTSKITYFFVLFLTSTFIMAQVGIGTNNPIYELQIVNTGNIGAVPLTQSTNSGTDGVSLSGYNSNAANGYNAIEGITDGSYSGVFGLYTSASGTGNGVYGTANSSDAIGVYGTIPTTGSWLGYGGLFTGGLGYVNGIYNVSDSRAKKDIELIENALHKILNIKGYTYKYNLNSFNSKTANNNKTHYGFIAQEIKKFLPNAVALKSIRVANDLQSSQTLLNDSGVIKNINVVDYTAVIPVLVEAMKEQQYIIDKQNQRIDNLEKKLNSILNK